jgi:K+-transporting ATPase KdpF subunit
MSTFAIASIEGARVMGDDMSAQSAVMLVICAGLMVYLLYALLKPEKF